MLKTNIFLNYLFKINACDKKNRNLIKKIILMIWQFQLRT